LAVLLSVAAGCERQPRGGADQVTRNGPGGDHMTGEETPPACVLPGSPDEGPDTFCGVCTADDASCATTLTPDGVVQRLRTELEAMGTGGRRQGFRQELHELHQANHGLVTGADGALAAHLLAGDLDAATRAAQVQALR